MATHSPMLQQVSLGEIRTPKQSHSQPKGAFSRAFAKHKSHNGFLYETPLTLASFWCIRSSSMVFCSSKVGA